jgi:hypothetical protein
MVFLNLPSKGFFKKVRENQMAEQNLSNSEKLVISSKKKWVWLGVLVALINPIFSGLIVGAVYLSEPELRRPGKIVSAIAILWGAVLFYLINQNFAVNLFGL